jgi:hypothetical protein
VAPRRRRAAGGGGEQQRDSQQPQPQQQQQQQQQHARGDRSLESFAVLNREDTPLVAFLGDGGHVGLVSLRGRQAAGGFKVNGSARAAAFSADGSRLVTAGGDGVVYSWDLRTRRCLGALRDDGSVGATALALGGGGGGLGGAGDGWMAVGGGSGVVNLYQCGGGGNGGGSSGASVLEAPAAGLWGGGGAFAAAPERPAPFRSLMHLTTAVDTLQFSADGQVRLPPGASLSRRSSAQDAAAPSVAAPLMLPLRRRPGFGSCLRRFISTFRPPRLNPLSGPHVTTHVTLV